MKHEPTCPRCGAALQPPGLWSSEWLCPQHGGVAPLHPTLTPNGDVLAAVLKATAVPVWLPWPLPSMHVVTGVAHAGDDRTGAVAVAVACSGPAPLGGTAELVTVAEQPGTGLGARLAGLPGPDAGDGVGLGPPEAKVQVEGHPTALWLVRTAPTDRAVYIGEALGQWLWVIAWPALEDLVLDGHTGLVDLREHHYDLPFGARSPRLP